MSSNPEQPSHLYSQGLRVTAVGTQPSLLQAVVSPLRWHMGWSVTLAARTLVTHMLCLQNRVGEVSGLPKILMQAVTKWGHVWQLALNALPEVYFRSQDRALQSHCSVLFLKWTLGFYCDDK